MSCERTHEEHVTDQLLMLVLLAEMGRPKPWQEVIKVMKAAFLSSWDMLPCQLKGFSLPFWVYKHGAFSKDFYRVTDSLKASGLVSEESRPTRSLFQGNHRFPQYQLTDEGESIIGECHDLLQMEPNATIVCNIVAAGARIAPLDPIDVRQLNHAMVVSVCGEEKPIDVLPQNTPLITLDRLRQVREHFVLDEDWLDTLDTLLDPEYDRGATRRGSDRTYNELFAGV